MESAERFDRIERKIEERLGEVKIGEERLRWVLEEMEERGEGAVEVGFCAGMRVGKEKVKDMLFDESDEMRIVGVCGMGGSGKTTLVKEICRDSQIKGHFFFPNSILFLFEFIWVLLLLLLLMMMMKNWGLVCLYCILKRKQFANGNVG